MRILIAPDKFKGTFTALEAATQIADGIRAIYPAATLDLCPLSDGGEGFVDAIITATRGTKHTARVTGPRPDQQVDATWSFLGTTTTAIIEMSSASGLSLLPREDRNPLLTTTFGTGELLLAAANAGATHILLGLGGSATNDAGLGLCQAVGHTILRRDAEPVSPHDPLTAQDLADIYIVKRGRGSPLDRIPITVACDVTNPLYGPNGASRTFAPQKGATPDQVDWLEAQVEFLAHRCHKEDEARAQGSGAAGGLGWALLSFFDATLTPGAQLVFHHLGLAERIKNADLVITGEGAFDSSSLHNKLPVAIANACKQANVPCALLAGRIDADAEGLLVASASLDGASLQDAAQRLLALPGIAHLSVRAFGSRADDVPSPMPAPDAQTRFSDRVADYVKYRPTYPQGVIDILRRECRLPGAATIADVGSGTGISSAPLLQAGFNVVAIEPNAEMRRAAEDMLGDNPRFRSVSAPGESTTLPGASVDLVIAAQAFHWFDRPRARVEFSRILRNPKPVALIWNDREVIGSPFLEGFESLLKTLGTDYAKVSHRNLTEDEAHIADFFGGDFKRHDLPNYQDLDEQALIGRALSSSYTPRAGDSRRDALISALKTLFAQTQVNDRVRMTYITRVYIGHV